MEEAHTGFSGELRPACNGASGASNRLPRWSFFLFPLLRAYEQSAY
jgi:hypothetical protein